MRFFCHRGFGPIIPTIFRFSLTTKPTRITSGNSEHLWALELFFCLRSSFHISWVSSPATHMPSHLWLPPWFFIMTPYAEPLGWVSALFPYCSLRIHPFCLGPWQSISSANALLIQITRFFSLSPLTGKILQPRKSFLELWLCNPLTLRSFWSIGVCELRLEYGTSLWDNNIPPGIIWKLLEWSGIFTWKFYKGSYSITESRKKEITEYI